MSRPRTPTQILQAKGSFLRHPERKRAREGEPKPNAPLGDPPPELDREQKAVWRKVAAKIPLGVASNCDEVAFEILVCLIVGFRHRRRRNVPQVVGEVAQIGKLLAQFGMTPADRSRVHAETTIETKDDPWAQFLTPLPRTSST